MTKLQKIYREIRKHLCREDARYAAPRIMVLFQQFRNVADPAFPHGPLPHYDPNARRAR